MRWPQSKAAPRTTGARCILAMVAAAHAGLGQPDVGLSLLDEAIRMVEATNERFFEAELHRLRGMMLLALSRESEAEFELRRALSIAEQQQAHWWELRAATTLAQHWHGTGKYLEAYALLQPVYGAFVEGFDTQSLKDAKVLLDSRGDISSPQAKARWV
jgi:predicted ATPase